MAKLRFPGKALKLNQRKTAKFVRTNEPSPEELRLIQIKKGLRLFRSVFGDSEEDDFEGFLPITNYEESNISSQQFKNTSNKKENKYITDRALKYKNCSSGPLNVKKLNGTKKLQKNNKRQHINEEQGKQDGIRKDTFLANNGRSSQIIIDNNCSSDENAVCSRKSCDNKISKVVNHNNTNKNEQSSEDDVPTSISLYTDHITEEPEIQPTRQSQRISDRHSNDHQIREKKIKEKIEKMLRSPWDSRLKQTPPKAPDDLAPLDNQQCIGTVGTDILRKPRLNLSKKTLQKIRSTSSINEFLPVPNDIPDGKCGFCQMIYSPGSLVKYGVSCCEQCNASITDIVESWDSSKICFGANGDCQLFGLSYEERCRACWIGRVLQSCIMPSLLHDRLRKQLPDVLKEKIPTSLGRNYNKSGTHELESILHPLHGNTFGSTVSLAGGWRRKIRGNSVVVISPSGKKFKSIRKLEKFLSKEGISADATMFFGNTASNERNMFHSFSNGQSVNKHKPSKKKGTSNVEVTNLPGGWERRIKWSSHNKFDTHIYSPDGKIFRHPNDLSDYFQKIGKMDDVQKYFPINNIAHYNNSGLSSCDTYSSTDLTSEDNSLYNSESNPNDEVNYNSEQMLVSDQYVPEDTQLLKQIVISNFDTDASGTEKTFEQDSYIESDATDTSAINIQSILSAEENDPDLDTDFHKQDDRKNSENTGSVFPNERIIVSESLKKYMPCPKSKKMLNLRMDKQSASETNTDNSSKFYSSLDNLFSNSAKMDDKSFEQEQTPKPSDSHEDKDEKIPKIHHKKLSTFTTERFGENWSRKIKWDDNGSGKISYITSPEGQKIHSRIELMAYFKKAGNPSATIDHYFPKTIIRSEIKEKPSKKLSKVKSSKTKNVVFGSQQANDTNQPKKIRKSLNKLSDTAASENGPRVKNVCRGAAQALKLPRAVFPEECPSNKTYKRMRTCKKCTGCLTPNCLKCSNCLSMKKYGGNGIKKHRCVLRTCLNPKRVQMHSELSTESDTSFLATDRTDSDVDESHCGKVQFPHLENEQSQSNSVMCNNVKTFEDTASLKSFTKKSSKNNDKTKKINHSASINIDYWHDYCTEDTAMTGFPIITTELPEVEAFCFRCGSAGQEKLIFCSLCCEGIHPFCLEEGELPESQIDCAEDVWVCRRCVVCHVCGTTGCEQLMQCSVCIKYFHLDCIGPLHHVGCLDKMTTWMCLSCLKCASCDSRNVVEWLELYRDSNPEPKSMPFCARCLQLREEKSYCPLCLTCYEDDDFDSKMMECAACKEWIHSHCEGLSDEGYQILSLLPDSVEYVCKTCLGLNPAKWLIAINDELYKGLETVLDSLSGSRFTKIFRTPIVNTPTKKSNRNDVNRNSSVNLHSCNVANITPTGDQSQSFKKAEDQSKSNKEIEGELVNENKSDQVNNTSASDETLIPHVDEDITIKKCFVRLQDLYKATNTDQKHAGEILQLSPCSTVDKSTFLSNSENYNLLTYSSDTALDDETDVRNTSNANLLCSDDVESSSMENSCNRQNIFVVPEMSSFCEPESVDPDISESQRLAALADFDSCEPILPRVSKDVDDDSDEDDDFKYLLDIKEKLKANFYKTVLEFHIDILRLLRTAYDKSQISSCKTFYIKILTKIFPWFDTKSVSVFSLINEKNIFPQPSSDHDYVTCQMDLVRREPRVVTDVLPRNASDKRKCTLCSRMGDDDSNNAGRLLFLGRDEWVHVNCCLWSSEVYEEMEGGLLNAFVAVSRGKQIKCSYCQERGASVGCCHKSCQATYHFMCARKIDCCFMENRTIICAQHKQCSDEYKPTADFKVSRCVYINLDAERRKWKPVPGSDVSVIIGSLRITRLGKIVHGVELKEVLIPVDYECSRLYWSTTNPAEKVRYTCTTKLVYPENGDINSINAEFHCTVDHSQEKSIVLKEINAMKEYLRHLEIRKLSQQTAETNIIPPHLCPLYQQILKAEREQSLLHLVSENEFQVPEEISDSVSRAEEDNLLFDAEIPNMVTSDDNEIISMVLRELPFCESLFHTTPVTSRPSTPVDTEEVSNLFDIQFADIPSNILHHSDSVENMCKDLISSYELQMQTETCGDTFEDQNIKKISSFDESCELNNEQSAIVSKYPTDSYEMSDIMADDFAETNYNCHTVENCTLTELPSDLVSTNEEGSDPNNTSACISNEIDDSQVKYNVSPDVNDTITPPHYQGDKTDVVSPKIASLQPDSVTGMRDDEKVPPTSKKTERQVCRVPPMLLPTDKTATKSVCHQNQKAAEPKRKIRMKRNYRTVIKKYPLRSGFQQEKPYETVQIEINETIEIPEPSTSEYNTVKRKWKGVVTSEKIAEKKTCLDTCDLSKKVVKFSDDRNQITVSIVNNNNNICEFSKKKKRSFRHRTLLQVDGAMDCSSSDGENVSQSTLALHIKQQSLARSLPGEEGPYKCPKCKRLYRTKDSYIRHTNTCNFEIDSSSTSEADSDNMLVAASEIAEPSVDNGTVNVADNTESNTIPSKIVGDDSLDAKTERAAGVHKQVRISIKPSGDKSLEDESTCNKSETVPASDVFVPPIVSPVKFSPFLKKTPSPRRYSNMRLMKGGNNYKFKKITPNFNISRKPPQAIAANHVSEPTSTDITNNANLQAIVSPSFSAPIVSPATSQITYSAPITNISSVQQIQPNIENPPLVTVMPGPSIAIPQGYTLQYVGSYSDKDIGSNILTYPQTPVVVPSPLVVAPQPTVMVPQVVNTNIAYTLATPEGLLLNQPSLQYYSQPTAIQPQQTFQTAPIIQQPTYQSLPPVVQFAQPYQNIQVATNLPPAIGTPCFSTQPSINQYSPVVSQNYVPPICNQMSRPVQYPPLSNSLPAIPEIKVKPHASVAPQGSISIRMPLSKDIFPASRTDTLPRSILSNPTVPRSVATVAPAFFTSTVSTSRETSSCGKTTTIVSIKPRPTYSYRDAMKDPDDDRKRKLEGNSEENEQSGGKKDTSGKDSIKNDETVQSYKLVLKRDPSSGSKLKVQPLIGVELPFSSTDIQELRIKAKVSVGPKRKKARMESGNSIFDQEKFSADKNIDNDLMVNEMAPNMSLDLGPNSNLNDDSGLFENAKAPSKEPYVVFELTADDGFKLESRHLMSVWKKVFDAVSEAKDRLSSGNGLCNREAATKENLSGPHMLGLSHNAVQYLLEQLPGSKDCHKYAFQFHRPSKDEEILEENTSGCARTEAFKLRSPYDIFSWLASKHRRLPNKSLVVQEELQLSARRATSMELPMAMRYRHLCENAREAVGVFRSSIHGRGLFCKRDIDKGEMVIEYAGQVIRSCLCDLREKSYESKGIGCYMFRVDEDTVIDATMHGNAARFINHSCNPNCFSRIVDILGKKHIIIFALRRITQGEELTYDYKFPIEEDKIPCSCGARRCRKYLN